MAQQRRKAPLTFFLDTNVLSYWLMARHVMQPLHDLADLPDAFLEVYQARYARELAFVDAVVAGGTSEALTANLALNEIWKVIKDEVTTVLQFQSGTPLSLWGTDRNRPPIKAELAGDLYDATMVGFDSLFNGSIQVIESGLGDKNYFETFAPIMLTTGRLTQWMRRLSPPRFARTRTILLLVTNPSRASSTNN